VSVLHPSRLRGGAAAALLTLLLAGCGDGGDAGVVRGVAAEEVRTLPADLLPKQVVGLRVTREDVSKLLTGRDRLYTEAVGFYGLRRGKQLMAALEVGQFAPDAPYQRASFRDALVAQVGGSQPRLLTVGDQAVHLTTVGKQTVYLWFAERVMYKLTVRSTFERPRTLLRALQAVAP